MAAGETTREGRVAIDGSGHEVWYRLDGDGEQALVGLHGGPGGSHRTLTRLAELAGDDLRVVLYDQLGSGRSDRPDDPSLWVVPRFVDELEALRRSLGLGPMHLFGQSWGGMLALQYALDHPEGVRTLILSNTGASVPHVFAEMSRLRLALGPERYATMIRHEAEGTLDHPDYEAAVLELYARHLRRATPWTLERSLSELRETILPRMAEHGPAYEAMWGPHEFLCSGPLLDWDVSDRLGEIRVPALIVCGLHDEVTLDVHRVLAERIPDNEWVIFGNSSHVTILEREADAYLGVIRDFVRRHAAERAGAGR